MGALLATTAGCSWIFTQPLPDNWRNYEPARLLDQSGPAAHRFILVPHQRGHDGLRGGVRRPPRSRRCRSRPGVVATTLWLSSAIYGFSKTNACRDALGESAHGYHPPAYGTGGEVFGPPPHQQAGACASRRRGSREPAAASDSPRSPTRPASAADRLEPLRYRRAIMMTLYHSPATAAMVVHWLLIELGLPHRLHPLDLDKGEQKAPAYLKLNPAGRGPDAGDRGRAGAARGGGHRAPPRRSLPGARALSGARVRRQRAALPVDVLPGQHAAAGLPRLVLPDRAGRARPTSRRPSRRRARGSRTAGGRSPRTSRRRAGRTCSGPSWRSSTS